MAMEAAQENVANFSNDVISTEPFPRLSAASTPVCIKKQQLTDKRKQTVRSPAAT